MFILKKCLLFIGLLSLASQVFAGEKLIFAIDIIRHGDRTPIANLPADNFSWPEGLGQLTHLGMLQERESGQHQRELYVKQYHLLPENYNPQSMYVRSSDFDRTLMSAEAFLSGLYPQGSYIPIHTVSQKEEIFLVPDNKHYHFTDLLKKYVYLQPDWIAKESEVKPNFPRWSQLTGVTITNLNQLKSVGDTLAIYQSHQVALPKDLTQADVNHMISVGRWAMVKSYQPKEVGEMTGHMFFNTIVGYLKNANEQSSALKYVLFSAHDSTIMSQLSVMGVPPQEIPPYASRLSILLFEVDGRGSVVRVTYNNRPVKIPMCGGVDCPLSIFNRLLS